MRTPEQRLRIAKAMLLQNFTGFTGFLFAQRKVVIHDTAASAPLEDAIMYVDMERIGVNLEAIEKFELTPENIVYGLCHEAIHLSDCHPQWVERNKGGVLFGKPFDIRLAHMACEAFVYQVLDAARLKSSARQAELLLHPTHAGEEIPFSLPWVQASPEHLGREAIYKILLEDPDKRPQSGRRGHPSEGTRSVGGAMLDHIDTRGAKGVSEEHIQREVLRAAMLDESSGKAGGGFSILGEYFAKPREIEMRWDEKLANFMDAIRGGDDPNWGDLNTVWLSMDMIVARKTSDALMRVYVGGDESGSISPQEFESFLGGLITLLRDTRPRGLTYIPFDGAVGEHIKELDADEIESMEPEDIIREIHRTLSGGTNYRFLFEKLDECVATADELPLVLVFTDGYPFDGWQEPREYPVVWVLTDRSREAPWGVNLYLDTEGQA